jgi:hypothetical protein
MRINRPFGNVKRHRHVGARATFGKQHEDFALADGERCKQLRVNADTSAV